jgi:membrane protein implicated in regulation of membrane protease activity
VRTGVAHLVDTIATVESVNDGIARARVEGELWEVTASDALRPQDRVVVREIDGLTLKVSKVKGVQTDV